LSARAAHGDDTPTTGATTAAGVVAPAAPDEAVAGDKFLGPEVAPEVHRTTTAGAAASSMASEVPAGGHAGSIGPSVGTPPSRPPAPSGGD
jgi:hypothetical protein